MYQVTITIEDVPGIDSGVVADQVIAVARSRASVLTARKRSLRRRHSSETSVYIVMSKRDALSLTLFLQQSWGLETSINYIIR